MLKMLELSHEFSARETYVSSSVENTRPLDCWTRDLSIVGHDIVTSWLLDSKTSLDMCTANQPRMRTLPVWSSLNLPVDIPCHVLVRYVYGNFLCKYFLVGTHWVEPRGIVCPLVYSKRKL